MKDVTLWKPLGALGHVLDKVMHSIQLELQMLFVSAEFVHLVNLHFQSFCTFGAIGRAFRPFLTSVISKQVMEITE